MTETIRVLCILETLNRGGTESMVMNIYRNIDRNKVQFDFVKHTNEKCQFENEILSLGGKIYEAPKYHGYNHFHYINWWKLFFINHPEYWIVHGHSFVIADLYLRIAMKNKRITISHIHTSNPIAQTLIEKVVLLIKKRHISRLRKYAIYKFACSNAAGEWAYKNNEFKVIKNAISIEKFRINEPLRNAIRIQNGLENNLVIGAVGNIHYAKNPIGIVNILNETLKITPKAKLLWVGNNETGYAREVLEYARELGIIDKIIFTGVISNVNEMMQAMDCFIMPSFYEGLPVVGIEAQAAGLPCYFSDRIPEEVCITDRCEMLPIENAKLWAQRIVEKDYERIDASEQIKLEGYDIADTSKWLQEFYLSLVH